MVKMTAEEFLDRCKAREEDFRGVDLSGSELERTRTIEESELRGVHFYQTALEFCRVIKSDLRGAIIDNTMLTKSFPFLDILKITFQDTIVGDGETVSYP